MNKVMLLGNLSKDPELITTNNGVPVCKFSIAVSRNFKNAEGERECDFINIVVWRAQAENCAKYLKKGSKVAVLGRLQVSTYEAKDGSKRYTTDVVADEVEFVSTPNNSQGEDKHENLKQKLEQASINDYPSELTPIEDDLPF